MQYRFTRQDVLSLRARRALLRRRVITLAVLLIIVVVLIALASIHPAAAYAFRPVCQSGHLVIVQSAGGRAFLLTHGATEPVYVRCY